MSRFLQFLVFSTYIHGHTVLHNVCDPGDQPIDINILLLVDFRCETNFVTLQSTKNGKITPDSFVKPRLIGFVA